MSPLQTPINLLPPESTV